MLSLRPNTDDQFVCHTMCCEAGGNVKRENEMRRKMLRPTENVLREAKAILYTFLCLFVPLCMPFVWVSCTKRRVRVVRHRVFLPAKGPSPREQKAKNKSHETMRRHNQDVLRVLAPIIDDLILWLCPFVAGKR